MEVEGFAGAAQGAASCEHRDRRYTEEEPALGGSVPAQAPVPGGSGRKEGEESDSRAAFQQQASADNLDDITSINDTRSRLRRRNIPDRNWDQHEESATTGNRTRRIRIPGPLRGRRRGLERGRIRSNSRRAPDRGFPVSRSAGPRRPG